MVDLFGNGCNMVLFVPDEYVKFILFSIDLVIMCD